MIENIPEIAIVVAIDDKRGIGRDGGLPWPRLPEDMRRFVDVTKGNPVIMGRVTQESIPSRFWPLPDRDNIVVSRQEGLVIPGGRVVHSLGEAIAVAAAFNTDRICVIGGGEIYREALPLADVLFLTRVAGDFEADTFFPEYADQFPHQQHVRESSYKGINYTFEDLTRVPR